MHVCIADLHIAGGSRQTHHCAVRLRTCIQDGHLRSKAAFLSGLVMINFFS